MQCDSYNADIILLIKRQKDRKEIHLHLSAIKTTVAQIPLLYSCFCL